MDNAKASLVWQPLIYKSAILVVFFITNRVIKEILSSIHFAHKNSPNRWITRKHPLYDNPNVHGVHELTDKGC